MTRTAAAPRWALLQQIRDHIDEHLGSPGLSPSSIATANFISTRRLHNVFLEQGMTVSAYVRSRRLERCHQDLVDPAQRDTPVAVIGARSGFTDAAHFLPHLQGRPHGITRRPATTWPGRRVSPSTGPGSV